MYGKQVQPSFRDDEEAWPWVIEESGNFPVRPHPHHPVPEGEVLAAVKEQLTLFFGEAVLMASGP